MSVAGLVWVITVITLSGAWVTTYARARRLKLRVECLEAELVVVDACWQAAEDDIKRLAEGKPLPPPAKPARHRGLQRRPRALSPEEIKAEAVRVAREVRRQ